MQGEGVGFIVAVTFTLNYIVGTGFLTLPWAFHAAGSLLATTVLLFITLLAVCSALMILETMSRAAALPSSSQLESSRVYQNYSSIVDSGANDSASDLNTVTVRFKEKDVWIIGDRKIEIVEMCERFLPQGKAIFIWILSVYLYGALWAYCTVFASALATATPQLGELGYYVYLLLYGAIVIPMSCLELSEQIWIQMFYGFCRVFLVMAMVGTIYLDDKSHGEHFSHSIDVEANWIKLSGFHVVVPIALYSNIFHHSIPALSAMVADKKQLTWIFFTTLALCFGAYTLIGVTLSSYFGPNIKSSSNLNWEHFYGSSASGVFRAIAQYIILFPAVDVMSAFPLSAITLGNNLLAYCQEKEEPLRRKLVYYRCWAALPPVVGACFVKDLGIVTTYTGITGFAIIFFFPALLSYKSRVYLERRGLPTDTFYSNCFTSNVLRGVLVAVGGLMILLIVCL